MIWKKEEINLSDFCDSYEPYPAKQSMIEAYKITPLPVRAWIARNERVFLKVKKCEDVD